MAEGFDDSSGLTGALGRVSISDTNEINKYVLNVSNIYTRCWRCCYRIPFSKDGLTCPCKYHWYCSPHCRDRYGDNTCVENQEIPNCDSLTCFYLLINAAFDDGETPKMIQDYLNSKPEISRKEIKKLAESGDWKAALIVGLTYELRFVCEWDKCAIALRPPFVKGIQFSHSKAIKYYHMAVEYNSTSAEAFAGLGRVLAEQKGQTRASKDYLLMSYERYQMPQIFLDRLFKNEFVDFSKIEVVKKEGTPFTLIKVLEVIGKIVFQLNRAEDRESSIVKECLRIPIVSKVYSLLQKPGHVLCCLSNQLLHGPLCRTVENEVFIQKADSRNDINHTLRKLDHGVKMDVSACQNLSLTAGSSDRPRYMCHHAETKEGDRRFCLMCSVMGMARPLSVVRNSYVFSKYESISNGFYSVVYDSGGFGLNQLEFFMNFSKYEIITAIRVMALQPSMLHPRMITADPDLYWPMVFYFGSIYSALKEVLDDETFNSVYESVPEMPIVPGFVNVAEDNYVIKCGLPGCNNLDWNFNFKKCTRCKLRRYCSKDCQTCDWNFHKNECFLRPGLQQEVD